MLLVEAAAEGIHDLARGIARVAENLACSLRISAPRLREILFVRAFCIGAALVLAAQDAIVIAALEPVAKLGHAQNGEAMIGAEQVQYLEHLVREIAGLAVFVGLLDELGQVG